MTMITSAYQPLRESIETKMREKDTDELIAIWQKPDHAQWSDEAFDVIKKILMERLGYLPNQEDVPPAKSKSQILWEDLASLEIISDRANFLAIAFLILSALGLIVCVWFLLASNLIALLFGIFMTLFCGFLYIVLKSISGGLHYLSDKEKSEIK